VKQRRWLPHLLAFDLLAVSWAWILFGGVAAVETSVLE
jgi:hypothetical protein